MEGRCPLGSLNELLVLSWDAVLALHKHQCLLFHSNPSPHLEAGSAVIPSLHMETEAQDHTAG